MQINITGTTVVKAISWIFLVFLLLITFIVAVDTSNRVDRLESDVASLKTRVDGTDGSVTFNSKNIQDIGEGFLLGVTTTTDRSGGTDIKGVMINATSVDRSVVKFDVKISDKDYQFSILEKIKAGGSVDFTWFVPGVPASGVTEGKITHDESLVHFL